MQHYEENSFTNSLIDEDGQYSVIDKCTNWLEKCSLDERESIYSDTASSSNLTETTENSALESGFCFFNNSILSNDHTVIGVKDSEFDLEDVFGKKNTTRIEKVNIYKSRKVHIGDVTYINGPVIVNQYKPIIHQTSSNNNTSDIPFNIISRRNWLAQPPAGHLETLKQPVKYVIIAHSATEEDFTQSGNILLIRLLQTFHIESRKWNDIAYNFLIGSDGSIFEGRGWDKVGAHSFGYNKNSIGICFVGCFTEHLPPRISLQKAKDFMDYGVEIGVLDKDFKVLGHCQCRPFQSPGRILFEEIKGWDRWDSSVSPDSPVQFGSSPEKENVDRLFEKSLGML